MKIDVLMIGRISEKPYEKLVKQYLARCSKRLPVNLVNCKNEDEMINRIKGKQLVVAMDEHAATRDSLDFCKWIEKKINSGLNRIVFCLGAAAGLNKRVKEQAHEFISLSPMTLNHQLALLVLAEQLYRTVSIMSGDPYHKA